MKKGPELVEGKDEGIEELGIQIVILDRGFVYIGATWIEEGKWVHVGPCKNIRVWGTKDGLGELALNGPTSSTVLDKGGNICAPWHALITFMNVDQDMWRKHI